MTHRAPHRTGRAACRRGACACAFAARQCSNSGLAVSTRWWSSSCVAQRSLV